MENDKLDYKNIERYFNNELTSEELLVFEERLETSTYLKEWVTIYNDLNHINNEEEWLHFKGDLSLLKKEIAQFKATETVDFSEKLKDWREEQKENIPRIKRYWLRPLVASVAAIFLVAVFLLYPKNDDLLTLYNQNNHWEDLPSLAVKGTNEDTVMNLERDFKSKKYQSVINNAQTLLETSSNLTSQILLYQGVSYIEISSYEKAIVTFDRLIQSNSIDFHKGYWYKALVFLKQEQKENCIIILETIVANPTYFKHQEAKDLLKELK